MAARLELARVRRETEQAIRQSEEHLRLALSAGRLGSWQLKRAGMHLSCSAQCKADFGYGPDDGFTYGQFRASLHPDDRARVEAMLDRALFVLGAFEAEFRCVLAGRQQPLDPRPGTRARG